MTLGTRRILAVMVVTTALCADQMSAAPAGRPEAVEIASIPAQLVSRLARSFRRVVPAAALRAPDRLERTVDASKRPPVVARSLGIARFALSYSQLRLPPPIV